MPTTTKLKFFVMLLLWLFPILGLKAQSSAKDNPAYYRKEQRQEEKRRAAIRKKIAKQNEKVEKANRKRTEKAHKKALKRHMELQTDETRKRMTYNQQRAGSNYKPHKRSFWDWLFSRDKPKR